MNRPSLKPPSPQSHSFATMLRRKRRFGCLAFCCAFAIGPFAGMAAAQAITIDTRGNPINGKEAPVDRRFAQIVAHQGSSRPNLNWMQKRVWS